jgi:hypothetical protein
MYFPGITKNILNPSKRSERESSPIMETADKLYCFTLSMQPSDICYLSWTLSSYEGLGFLTTDDPKAGIVSVFTPRGNEAIMREVLHAISQQEIRLNITEEQDKDEYDGKNTVSQQYCTEAS